MKLIRSLNKRSAPSSIKSFIRNHLDARVVTIVIRELAER